MLGAKSTCKDRWRQVLSEAQRIPNKHLLTLEPGISENQTDEMQAKRLQLILPAQLHATYRRNSDHGCSAFRIFERGKGAAERAVGRQIRRVRRTI